MRYLRSSLSEISQFPLVSLRLMIRLDGVELSSLGDNYLTTFSIRCPNFPFRLGLEAGELVPVLLVAYHYGGADIGT